ARFAARAKLSAGESPGPAETAAAGGHPEIIQVLFLANGLREKGLFAAMHGVVAANRTLATERSNLHMQLIFAGNFMTEEERGEFERLMQQPEYGAAVRPLGFVSGAEKSRI